MKEGVVEAAGPVGSDAARSELVWSTPVVRALASGDSLPDGFERLRVRAPPLLAGAGGRALLGLPLAAMVIAVVVLRPGHPSPLDPLALLLRLVAVLFAVRGVLGLVLLGRRVRLGLRASAHALVLGEAGLVYRSPTGTVVVQREDVLAVAERGDWRERRTSRRYAPVYVVLRPGLGVTHLELPPILDDSPGVLAERLMRWRGALPPAGEPPAVDPSLIASALYDEVARGARPEGTTAIRHGWGFLAHGPFATMLLAVALLDGYLRLGPLERGVLGWSPLAWLALAFVGVPLGWFLLAWREIAPRKGLALVMTPSELLIRTRRGLLRTAWTDIASVSIDARAAWSVVLGQHERRRLLLHRRDVGGSTIRYDEHFLGVPAEVAEALVQAYRHGRARLPSEPGAEPDGTR